MLVALHAAVPRRRASRRCCGSGWRYVLAAVVIGAGSSAHRDDPLHAGVRRRDGLRARRSCCRRCSRWSRSSRRGIILGERPRPRFAFYLVAGARRHVADRRAAPASSDGARRQAVALRARRRSAVGARDGARPLPLARHALRARGDAALRVRAARERDRAARARRARRSRRGTTRAGSRVLALVTGFLALGLYYYGLRVHAGGRRDARRARVPGQRDPRRLLQVRPDAHGLAVGRRRDDEPRRCAPARAAARPDRVRAGACTAPHPPDAASRSATSARATDCRTSPRRSRRPCAPSSSRGWRRPELPRIEAVSFVRDDRVPQMAGAEEVVAAAERGQR